MIPSYAVTQGIVFSSSGDLVIETRKLFDPPAPLDEDLWAFANLEGDAVILIIHLVAGLVLLAVIESGILDFINDISFRSIPPPKSVDELDLDDDVIAEEERVRAQTLKESNAADTEAGMSQPDFVRVADFRKAYTTLFGEPFLAVERISFGLDYGECFALLGVNGAGKSTTFKALTKDVNPSQGKVVVGGYDIQKDFAYARKLIGYCPQRDAIFNLMTVEEHIWFYARLRGIPSDVQT